MNTLWKVLVIFAVYHVFRVNQVMALVGVGIGFGLLTTWFFTESYNVNKRAIYYGVVIYLASLFHVVLGVSQRTKALLPSPSEAFIGIPETGLEAMLVAVCTTATYLFMHLDPFFEES